MDYTLQRSAKRRTICIKISDDGKIIVIAPYTTTIERIEKLLLRKQNWIEKNVAQRKEAARKRALFSLNFGDRISICGKEYLLQKSNKKTANYDENNAIIYLYHDLDCQQIKQQIIKILKLIAKEKCTQFALEYRDLTGFSYESIKINSAKTRWGSCSAKNTLNFSFRLILADEMLVRCVVLHELCHTKEHNHSKKFWDLMKCFMPNYKELNAALKLLHRKISCEDWD